MAVRTNGASEVLVHLDGRREGLGHGGRAAEPLLLQAVTALPRDDIAHLQVQSVDANGTTETLVHRTGKQSLTEHGARPLMRPGFGRIRN